MNELIAFLRNKTHMARLAESEVAEVITKLEEGGYSIVKKAPAAPASSPSAAAPAPQSALVANGASPEAQQAAQVAQAPVPTA